MKGRSHSNAECGVQNAKRRAEDVLEEFSAGSVIAIEVYRGLNEIPAEFAGAVRTEAQILRHRAHDKLMKAFLGPEVFEGTVVIARSHAAPAIEQLRLA